MDEEVKEINKVYNTNMTLEDIPLDDKKTWDAFCNFNTQGVFQFSSNVAQPVLLKIKPRNIEELAAANAFIRPGASGLDWYIEGKDNKDKIKKFDPRLDEILAPTYGAIVFQEQIMGLISKLMGISFGKADIYRRALEKMHKPKNKKIVEEFNNNVIDKAVELGYSKEVAEEIRKLIIENSGYGFNVRQEVLTCAA